MALPSLRENLHTGPKDASLLTQQHNHISSLIWSGQDRLLRARQCYFPPGPKPHESILTMLKTTGFGYVAQIENVNIDISLISALVERWRPETRTFHFPNGECTITLEDVALQLGIPIDGDAVTGTIPSDLRGRCRELLGAAPPKNTWDDETLELSWLATKFEKLPNDASMTVVKQHTRAYILRLIGGLLMPDRLGTKVDLMYLPLLENLSKVGHYSWGSAVLACLYRELCRASKTGSTEIGGCLVLLQAWAWDRIPTVAPPLRTLSDDQASRGWGFPLARRWSQYFKNTKENVRAYRLALDQLDDHEFIWTPYASPTVRRFIPEDPGEVCYAMVPLICFGIIEWHHPDRVMRQFGLRQPIPHPPTNMDRVEGVSMIGRAKWNVAECGTWINLWMQRRDRLLHGRPFHGQLDQNSDYMRWYLNVTRRWISCEGARVGTMVFGVRNILKLAKSETTTNPTITSIIHTCNEMINVSQQYYQPLPSKNWQFVPPAKENFRAGDIKNVAYKQPPPPPQPMGYYPYSQSYNPIQYKPPPPPPPYPSSSYHVPHNNAPFPPSWPHNSYPGAPNAVVTAKPGTASTTYPPMVDMKSVPQRRPPVPASTLAPANAPAPFMPYTETEDEEESEYDSEFSNELYG
ncbi:hypothetical protein RJT34_27598 [Clitoria ternatea]|uniref:Aminotransferase-like plant mobile domain-containing protein n=1 Tax=Clitoria ternatea TaxID=43366 RepID=A0AAN9FCE8_CLITE